MKTDKSTDAWHNFNVERETIRMRHNRLLVEREVRYHECHMAHGDSALLEATYRDSRRAVCREYRNELRVVRDFYLA